MIKLETMNQFNELRNEKTVFLFSAKWCPDCRVIEPFLPELEQEFSEYQFVYVDRDDFIDICIEHDILGIPSFVVYDESKVIGTFISKFRKTKTEIRDFLNGLNK